ncbi:acyltransferase family protein [Vibrio cholerae]|uniref:acyltransferase family protein n=1 Tax=Vibrio cholerae TaxID=666 RepID=UPI003080C3E1
MKYRNDIQVLRGFAVLYVVLFHLGFQTLQSGFLGVDVFFVISGFLMAVLYDGSSTKQFFLRRAKRLLPAYYVVILFTLIASFIFTTKNESNQVISQAYFGLAYLSNIGFWLQNSYFSKAEFNPLLHLWSLSVEIQFYLIVPVLAYCFKKVRNSIALIIFISMMLCFLILKISPKTSFFMMPLRVWEFLLGYSAALYLTSSGEIKYIKYRWLGGVGLLLIMLIPFLKVEGDSLSFISGHPGLISLLVSISTCLVLIFGLPLSFEASMLLKIMIKLGKYSYSLYLVHFPVIVIYLSKPFEGTNFEISSFEELTKIIVFIVVLTIALHKLVETRNIKVSIVVLALLSSACIFLISYLLPIYLHSLHSEKEQYVFNAFKDRVEYRCGKVARIINPSAISCNLSPDLLDGKGAILLVGNSHADSIKTTFKRISEKYSIATHFMVPNNPLMLGGLPPESIVAEADKNNIKHIVVHFSPNSIPFDNLNQLVKLSQLKNIIVSFIDPVPIWPEHIPKMMYYKLEGLGSSLLQTKDDYLNENKEFLANVGAIESDNFKKYSVVDYFCSPTCRYSDNVGVPYYFDTDHLTLTGSDLLVDLFDKIVKDNMENI